MSSSLSLSSSLFLSLSLSCPCLRLSFSLSCPCPRLCLCLFPCLVPVLFSDSFLVLSLSSSSSMSCLVPHLVFVLVLALVPVLFSVSFLILSTLSSSLSLFLSLLSTFKAGECFLRFLSLFAALQMTMISASTGSLIAVTVERYRAICMPFSPALSRLQARLMIALVWLVSFLVALPELGAYVITDSPVFPCVEHFPDMRIRQAYSLFLLIAMYVLPLLLIFPAYARMIWKLWQSERNEDSIGGCIQDPKAHKRKKNVIKMMAIVVTAYAICLMPYHAIWLWYDYGTGWYLKVVVTVLVIYLMPLTTPYGYGTTTEQVGN